MVDTLDLGSSAARRGGSSPFSRTISFLIIGFLLIVFPVFSQDMISESDIKAALKQYEFPILSGKFTLVDTARKMRDKMTGAFYQGQVDSDEVKVFLLKNPSRVKGKKVVIRKTTDGDISARMSQGFKLRKSKTHLLGSIITYQDLEGFDMQEMNVRVIEYMKQGFDNIWKVEFYPRNEEFMFKYGFKKAMVFLNGDTLLPERIGYRPLNKSYYRLITFKSYQDIKGMKVPKVIQIIHRNKSKRFAQSVLSFQGLKRKKKIKSKYYEFDDE